MNFFKKISSFFKELLKDDLIIQMEEFQKTLIECSLERTKLVNSTRLLQLDFERDSLEFVILDLKNTIRLCSEGAANIEAILNGCFCNQRSYDDYLKSHQDYLRLQFQTESNLVIQEDKLRQINSEILHLKTYYKSAMFEEINNPKMNEYNEDRSDSRKVCSIP